MTKTKLLRLSALILLTGVILGDAFLDGRGDRQIILSPAREGLVVDLEGDVVS